MAEIEKHYVNRSNWLRAAVLGANDGILSTASLAVGIAAASNNRPTLVLATLSGLVAGALSMAAGEYVSVSSQQDIEQADLAREKMELEHMPEHELQELAEIYEKRGLQPQLALEVAEQLHAHDALAAHARDELGITDISQARPLQAAIASGLSFMFGGGLPFLVAWLLPMEHMVVYQYIFTLLFLIFLGSVSAVTGGAKVLKAIVRILFWGTVTMGTTAMVGYLFGINLG